MRIFVLFSLEYPVLLNTGFRIGVIVRGLRCRGLWFAGLLIVRESDCPLPLQNLGKMNSKPSQILVSSPDGSTVVCRCLPCTARKEFLELWDMSWEIVKNDPIAPHLEILMAIGHIWDNSPEFRWLCLRMLEMHNIEGSLDLPQIVELLFFHEEGNGLLVSLQFPPMPVGSKPSLPKNADPHAQLLAILAYRTGDWAAAKQALDTIPYDALIQALQINPEGDEKKPNPTPSNPGQESLLQKSRSAFRDGEVQSGLDAIRERVAGIRQ